MTGSDTLLLALLGVHAAENDLAIEVPITELDR